MTLGQTIIRFLMPFDCLKIGRAFVVQLSQSHLEDSIIAAIINMMERFKVELVGGYKPRKKLIYSANFQGPGFLFSKPIHIKSGQQI